MTGISVDTLRAWERRYGAVVPNRGDRGRLYSDVDVTRLSQLHGLVQHGHAIGTIAGLSDAKLARLFDRTTTAGTASEPPLTANLDVLHRALDAYDLERIESALNRFTVTLPVDDLVFLVILPFLRDVGRRWELGELNPAQEHLVSAVVRSVVGGLLRTTPPAPSGARVIFAAPSGERHELGLLCGALLAASRRCLPMFLGSDVPATDIVHAANTTGAEVVVVGLTTPGAVARRELRRLLAIPAHVQLLVGGPDASRALSTLGPQVRHVNSLSSLATLLARQSHG